MQLEHEEFVGIFMRFAQRVALKLRDMNIVPPINDGTAKSKRLFNELLARFEQMKKLKEDIAQANALRIRQDMKQAAVEVAKKTYQEEERSVVGCVVEILVLHHWTVADAVAQALVRELTTTEKVKKAIRRGENAEGGEVLSLRYLIHLAPAHPIKRGCIELAREYEEKVVSQFGPGSVQVEDVGWMQGKLASTDEIHGTPDGVFMIVRVVDTTRAFLLKGFLQVFCAGRVSMVQLFNEGCYPLNENVGHPDTDSSETR